MSLGFKLSFVSFIDVSPKSVISPLIKEFSITNNLFIFASLFLSSNILS